MYVEETKSSLSSYYSGAFGITIVAFVLSLIIGVIGLADWFMDKGK